MVDHGDCGYLAVFPDPLPVDLVEHLLPPVRLLGVRLHSVFGLRRSSGHIALTILHHILTLAMLLARSYGDAIHLERKIGFQIELLQRPSAHTVYATKEKVNNFLNDNKIYCTVL